MHHHLQLFAFAASAFAALASPLLLWQIYTPTKDDEALALLPPTDLLEEGLPQAHCWLVHAGCGQTQTPLASSQVDKATVGQAG